MMRKTMRVWMHLILSAAFTSAYANQVDCDFEKDSCNWSIEGFRRISDNQFNSTDGWIDNVHRNGDEWYLLFDATNESYATLTSIQRTNEGLQCLNFWYIFRGSRESQIQVLVQGVDGGNVSAILQTSMSNTGWRRATVEIDLQYSSMVTILIQGRTGRSYSNIGIDDIVLKLSSCLDCNFLDGLCSWEGEEWHVPTNVNFAVTVVKPKKLSVLTSGLDIYPGEKCLSFKYQMKDFKRECIVIDVYSIDGISSSLVWWSQSQNESHGWNEINVTINVGDGSKIKIRFGNVNCYNVTYYISSISLKKQSCTESTDIATTTAATSVNTSSHYANDGVIIDIVIGGLSFTVAVFLIATYLYRRRASSPNANISQHSTVSSVTYSGASRPKTDNGDTSHSTERLNHTSETVSFNAQAEYSTVLKMQPRQSKTQHRCITGILNIYPCHVQLLNNDGNNVTNPEQTHNQYHRSADKDGTNSYDAVHNMVNHTTEFRDDTYDCTTIHPTIPDPTYDHSNFKQNSDNIYDHSNSGTLSKDMGYLDQSCNITFQRSMQDVDPTYDHI